MKAPKRHNKIFYWNYYFTWIPTLQRQELRWKDKFNSPRCETEPFFRFEWLYWGWYQSVGDDQYWEQWLWIHKYCDGDEVKAEATWPWSDSESGVTNWIKY